MGKANGLERARSSYRIIGHSIDTDDEGHDIDLG